MAADEGPALRWVSRPLLLVVFVVIVAVVAAGGFWAGTRVHGSSYAVTAASQEPLDVFAPVEKRVVADGLALAGAVTQGHVDAVVPPAPAGTSQPVATTVDVAAGQQITSGELLGRVSDRPIFALATQIPLYRALHAGDEGRDVAAFQRALGVAASGRIDAPTLRTVNALYRAVAAPPPGFPGMSYVEPAEFTVIRAGSARVVSAAAVGTVLSAEHPLVSIQAGANTVSTRATVTDAAKLKTGTAVQIRGGRGGTTAGTVTTVGAFSPPGQDSDGNAVIAGHDVTIALDTPTDAADLQPGSPVTVQTKNSATAGPAVPLVALRQGAPGTYVIVKSRGSDAATREVAVTVTAQSNGWAAIARAELKVGDQVKVAP